MAKLEDLETAIDALIADQKTFIADVQAEVATLVANSGPNTAQYDALIAKVAAAKDAVDAADAATKTPAPVDPAAPAEGA